MKCPKCDNELSYDEVDIGVGLMKGNYHCDACGWNERTFFHLNIGVDNEE